MKKTSLLIAAIAFSIAPIASRAQSVRAEIDGAIQEFLAAHPEQIQAIVKDYLTKNPEVLSQALTELIKRRTPPAQANVGSSDKVAVIHDNEAVILKSPHQVVLGNPNGRVTLVEFFDYNCGFCKRALGDMQALLKDDPDLRIVLKEFPILGPGSLEAAKVAVAVRMQDPSGKKYLNFHLALMGNRGPANKEAALSAAKAAGIDLVRLDRDLADPEIMTTLTETTTLARTLGVNGTPGYVIGNATVAGAIGEAGLKNQIALAKSTMH